MRRSVLVLMLLVLASIALPVRAADVEARATILLTVDAQDLPRNLLRSEMKIQAEQGIASLAFPLWIPGNHAPSGPIQNVGEIRVYDCDGNELSWTRSIEFPEQIELDIEMPPTCVLVEMTYIASQPSVISGSSDSYGRPNFGAINWNTVLLYPIGPEGVEYSHQSIQVGVELTRPRSWRYQNSISMNLGPGAMCGVGVDYSKPQIGRLGFPLSWSNGRNSIPGAIDFQSLASLIDRPVIIGEHLHTTELVRVNGTPHRFHVVASEERFTEPHDWFIEKLNAMHEQAVKIFGPFPRERYDYLIVLDDHVRFGLEHAESTFIGTKQRRLIDAEETETKGGGGDLTVIPHEYIHVWCGKLRAPEGMRNDAFHEDRDTELLWVYEGLTTYYTDVLAARAGLITREEYEAGVVGDVIAYTQRVGRSWRPLTDTARAAGMLRDRGKYWIDYRRGQDYYSEGALFWMEADAIIRERSGGEKSLDDFCKAFFDVPTLPVGAEATYTRADVVEALTELEPSADWDRLIRTRIEKPVETLGFETLLGRLGVALVFDDEPTALQKADNKGSALKLRTSLGMDVNEDGSITHLTPGSPADKARLAYGMRIVAVDGFVFTKERLEDAVKATKETGSIEFVLASGERIETRTIEYAGGRRWPKLVGLEGKADVIGAIVEPR